MKVVPRRVTEIVLFLAVICLISFNALTLTASAAFITLFEGINGTYVLIALIVLIVLIIGFFIYLKYYRKKGR